MAAKIGTGNILFRVGSGSPSKVFLGSTAVQTVPGAPTVAFASTNAGQTFFNHSVPSDGGSPITTYKYYFDGVESTPNFVIPVGDDLSANFTTEFTGQAAEVSAVNAIGEGPKSDPVTVT